MDENIRCFRTSFQPSITAKVMLQITIEEDSGATIEGEFIGSHLTESTTPSFWILLHLWTKVADERIDDVVRSFLIVAI